MHQNTRAQPCSPGMKLSRAHLFSEELQAEQIHLIHLHLPCGSPQNFCSLGTAKTISYTDPLRTPWPCREDAAPRSHMLLLVCVLRQVASFRQYTSEWRSTTQTLICRRRFALRSIRAWRKSSDTFCISQPAYEFCRSCGTARSAQQPVLTPCWGLHTHLLPTGHLRGYFSGEGSSASTKSLHKGAGRGAIMGR